MTKLLILLLCGLLLSVPAHAAPNSPLRYFEGEMVIEETNDHGMSQLLPC